MRCRVLYLAILVIFGTTLSLAQHSAGPPPSGAAGSINRGGAGSPGSIGRATQTIDLIVHVVLPNDQPAGENIGVELQAAMGSIIGEQFTDFRGEVAFHGIPSGSYVVNVRGGDVKDTSSGQISIDPYDTMHTEYIHVQRVEDANAVKSTQGSISAAELKIPEKARKEFGKGNELVAKGDLKKGQEHYEKAISIYPRYPMAYNNLGVVYMKSGDKIHAREAWNKALDADPDLATANANVARLDVVEQDFSGAIPLLDRALAIQPTNGDDLLLMCEAQLLAGHPDQALLYARKVHAIDQQKYAMAHIIAGRALEAQNRPDLARVEYEVLLKEAPSAPEAGEARKSIARLDDSAKK